MLGVKRIGPPSMMLNQLARRSGGIPGFARDALVRAGIDRRALEEADRVGREARPEREDGDNDFEI